MSPERRIVERRVEPVRAQLVVRLRLIRGRLHRPHDEQPRPGLRHEPASIERQHVNRVAEPVQLTDRGGQVLAAMASRQPHDVLQDHDRRPTILHLIDHGGEMPERPGVLSFEAAPPARQRQVYTGERRPGQRQAVRHGVNLDAADVAQDERVAA